MQTSLGISMRSVFIWITIALLLITGWEAMPHMDALKQQPRGAFAMDWMFRFAVLVTIYFISAAITMSICFMDRLFQYWSNDGILPPSKSTHPNVLIGNWMFSPTLLTIVGCVVLNNSITFGILFFTMTFMNAGIMLFCASVLGVRWLHYQGLMLPRHEPTGIPELTEVGFPVGIHRVSLADVRTICQPIAKLNTPLFELLYLSSRLLKKAGCDFIWIAFHQLASGELTIEGCYQTPLYGDLGDPDFILVPGEGGMYIIQTPNGSLRLYPDTTTSATMPRQPWRVHDRSLHAQSGVVPENVISFLQKVNKHPGRGMGRVGILQVKLCEEDLLPMAPDSPKSAPEESQAGSLPEENQAGSATST